MPKRRRLARGIFEDTFGISVIYSQGGKPIETRFPRGASLDRLIRWRARQIAQRPEVQPSPSDSLTRDCVRYLRRFKGRPSYASEKSHLRAWIALFGRLPRRTLTREQIELTIARWRQAGYSANTIRHRCRALEAVYRALDAADAPTPLDAVTLPKVPRPRPVSVSDETIRQVAAHLRIQEQDGIGRLRTMKTRARFLVLATHAQRPTEMQRAQPVDVDLERGLWAVRGAKGGYSTIVPLNAEQRAAWKLFVAAEAWGSYDTRSFARTLRTAGWPTGIRPYNLRHSTGFALSARGIDLGDIQALMGHVSPETTRIYVPGLKERLESAVQKLDGRIGVDAFLPRPTLPRTPRRTAKAHEKARQSREAVQGSGPPLRSAKSKKTA